MSNKKILLGTVQMGLPYGVNNTAGRVTYAEAEMILVHAHSSGIQILDTAEAYGKAHTEIGRFHQENPDLRFDIITKLSKNEKSDQVRLKLESFLNELHVDSLYALMFHSYDEYDNFKDHRNIISELKEAGSIRKFGVSVYTNEQVEALSEDPVVDFIQLPFNLLDNESQRGSVLRKAKKYGKEIHTRSAFLQGLFFMKPDSDHPAAIDLKRSLDQIRSIAKRENLSLPALALGYCMSKPYIDHVLIGVDSKLQLTENLKGLMEGISDEVISEIDEIQVANKDTLNPSLWNQK